MSLNTAIVVWCVAVPAIVACVAALLSRHWIVRRVGVDGSTAAFCCSGVGGATVALGWWIGLMVAMAARQWVDSDVGWLQRLQGVEAWQTSLWPLLLFTAVPSLVGDQRTASVRLVAAAVLASLLACAVIPSGDAWADSMYLHRPWSSLLVASVMLNTFSLDGLIRSGAKVWPLLVMIAGTGPAFLLVSLNYAAPAEWILAGLAGTSGVLLAAGWTSRPGTSQNYGPAIAGLSAAVTLPVAGLIATAVVTARFYTWEEYPAWLYAVALFLPTLVAVVDFPLQRFDGKLRISVAASISAALIAACVWKLILQDPESW